MNLEPRRHVGLTMPMDLHRRLTDAAAEHERTVSAQVRRALRDHLDALDRARTLHELTETRG